MIAARIEKNDDKKDQQSSNNKSKRSKINDPHLPDENPDSVSDLGNTDQTGDTIEWQLPNNEEDGLLDHDDEDNFPWLDDPFSEQNDDPFSSRFTGIEDFRERVYLDRKNPIILALASLIIVLLIIAAAMFDIFDFIDDDDEELSARFTTEFDDPVLLEREFAGIGLGTQDIPEGVIGYEPSLAVDSTGAMFYTAHKDLAWENSWDYTASWWFISTDNGQTWRNPQDPLWNTFPIGGKYIWPGDEGDIAVDGNDLIYFVDTTLVDNNFHVFSNHGDSYEGTKVQGSTLFDDRPWITAQGNGILHYLGNNAVTVMHPTTGESGRVWYYRSLDGGMTWSLGEPIEGGWATIDAERNGDHVYVAQVKGFEGRWSVIMRSSDDQGENWNDPVYVGPHQNQMSEGMPIVFSGSEGRVFVIWQCSYDNGETPGVLYFARSTDYGMTFEHWNVSLTGGAIYLYPTVNVCSYGIHHENNRLGIAFYGTQDVPVGTNSTWYLYSAVAEDPGNGTQFNFEIADPEPVYTGDDLHALHDFFELVIAPDGSINIAYQRNIGQHPFEPGEEQRYLMFIRGVPSEI